MATIMWFKDITKKDIAMVGGKGANLGEMFHHFSIPDGFCVTTESYKEFMTNNEIDKKIYALLDDLDTDDTKRLDEASKEIEQLILSKEMSSATKKEILSAYKKLGGHVAVRSSATAEDLAEASFAGQQASFLNIDGEENLLQAVKQCWASLFTARAIYYRVTNKFVHKDVFISVVVQKMIQSRTAGVMFTANPINNSRDEMVIEGSWGLGEMVVSGQVTPDTFMIKKEPLAIYQESIGEKRRMMVKKGKENKILDVSPEKKEKASLSKEEVLALAKEGLSIEKHYGSPQDIEWGIDDAGDIFILQSRPITTLR